MQIFQQQPITDKLVSINMFLSFLCRLRELTFAFLIYRDSKNKNEEIEEQEQSENLPNKFKQLEIYQPTDNDNSIMNKIGNFDLRTDENENNTVEISKMSHCFLQIQSATVDLAALNPSEEKKNLRKIKTKKPTTQSEESHNISFKFNTNENNTIETMRTNETPDVLVDIVMAKLDYDTIGSKDLKAKYAIVDDVGSEDANKRKKNSIKKNIDSTDMKERSVLSHTKYKKLPLSLAHVHRSNIVFKKKKKNFQIILLFNI
jgi:hypothetical protein